MNLVGDEFYHPFLWDRGKLIDLGTFGGHNGEANWMNDAGEIVGYGYFAGDQVRHAFSWRNGVKKDLAPPTGDLCSMHSASTLRVRLWELQECVGEHCTLFSGRMAGPPT